MCILSGFRNFHGLKDNIVCVLYVYTYAHIFGGIDFNPAFYESLLLFLSRTQIIEKPVNFS